VRPLPAELEDIARVHGKEHIENVRRAGMYDPAALAAELAEEYKAGLGSRPPGHHASANRAWGMCYFNNMAIAVKKFRLKAKRALIIDVDLHFGDGTVSIFWGG